MNRKKGKKNLNHEEERNDPFTHFNLSAQSIIQTRTHLINSFFMHSFFSYKTAVTLPFGKNEKKRGEARPDFFSYFAVTKP